MNTIIKNLLFCFMLLILSACDEQNKTTNKEEELVPKSAIEQINRQINEVPEDVGVHYYGLEQNIHL